ncbi:MAG TPA: hypothetical protein VGK20_13215 [Candidatus Binatia bacterium]|jgi:hypothetical protein
MKPAALMVAALVLALPVHASAVTTSPGKTSVAATETGALDAIGDMVPVTVTLAKGKPKQLLMINVAVSIGGDPSLPALYTIVTVNGTAVSHPGVQINQCNTASFQYCTITTTNWVDIDAAELAGPGLFVGQPLTIVVTGGNNISAGTGLGFTATVTATLVKK